MSWKGMENVCGFKEMKNYNLVIRQLLSEFLGSLLYLSLVLSAGIGIKSTNDNEGRRIEHGTATVLIAVANGLVVASIITIFGHVSGAHINPAVTCGAMICKHIKPVKAVCYVIVQIVGGVAGAGIAYLLSSETIRGDLGAIIPYKHLREYQIFGLEFLMTFMLVAVVLSVIDTTRGARGLGSAPLAIGLSITAGICSCSPYTASMNPIRSLGPAVIMNRWDSHWVYWVGPMAGGLVAGLTYRCLLLYHQQTIVLQSSRIDINRMLDRHRSE
ncbi:unnamed protein product [Arctia plantaginis]|uniref:Aquaporin n=1 Tax=Arctia plantaginis TaxID=874455 RepID=A0A8S1BAY9_ARCPL|nr:unnamed protein product [Arctia plantaginis]